MHSLAYNSLSKSITLLSKIISKYINKLNNFLLKRDQTLRLEILSSNGRRRFYKRYQLCIFTISLFIDSGKERGLLSAFPKPKDVLTVPSLVEIDPGVLGKHQFKKLSKFFTISL